MANDDNEDRRGKITLENLGMGREAVVSFDGASQYAQGGPSTCGLASMNAVRVILARQKSGTKMVEEMSTKALMEEILLICAFLPDQRHLEVDDLQGMALFRHSVNRVSTMNYPVSLDSFRTILRQLQTLSRAPGTRTPAKVSAVVITRPPEIIAVFHILMTDHDRLTSVFAVFDSHPRPAKATRGASFIFHPSVDAAAGYLSQLFYVDPALRTGISTWEAELLSQFAADCFTLPDDYDANSDARGAYEANLELFRLRREMRENPTPARAPATQAAAVAPVPPPLPHPVAAAPPPQPAPNRQPLQRIGTNASPAAPPNRDGPFPPPEGPPPAYTFDNPPPAPAPAAGPPPVPPRPVPVARGDTDPDTAAMIAQLQLEEEEDARNLREARRVQATYERVGQGHVPIPQPHARLQRANNQPPRSEPTIIARLGEGVRSLPAVVGDMVNRAMEPGSLARVALPSPILERPMRTQIPPGTDIATAELINRLQREDQEEAMRTQVVIEGPAEEVVLFTVRRPGRNEVTYQLRDENDLGALPSSVRGTAERVLRERGLLGNGGGGGHNPRPMVIRRVGRCSPVRGFTH
ncbi:hypothetical protein SISSUDRAFT_1042668 [Sistotremastrum suecicum HHB10207 ss-3]|uniref:Uncharacterized protein n=1 Tax=Sistotremastrum suecicum HHB10207 ss-3 TaxID=1314776 RepID=A0A166GE01_9AGAM|nr:hypothetical protein SISSUDRAFT_1042668 [Sistotremastrum suecicum HHB10207 ss-3]